MGMFCEVKGVGDVVWFNVSDVGLVGGVGGPQVKASAFTWGFAD